MPLVVAATICIVGFLYGAAITPAIWVMEVVSSADKKPCILKNTCKKSRCSFFNIAYA